MYTRKFIIRLFFLVSFLIYLHKHIKLRQWESYLNIPDSLLLACLLYLLVAKYLIAKIKGQEKARVLFV